MVVNVGHPEGSDRLERVLSETVASVFEHVVRDPIEEVNTLLIASDRPVSAERMRAAVPDLPADLRPIALQAAGRIGPRLTGGTIYTDDHAPVEWLIDKSILDYAQGAE